MVRGIGADEWFAVLALACTAGVTADIIVGTRFGFGRHLTAHTTGADLVVTLKVRLGFRDPSNVSLMS